MFSGVEDARTEPDVVASALEIDALEIIVEDLARHPTEHIETKDVAVQEALERLVKREAGVLRTGP